MTIKYNHLLCPTCKGDEFKVVPRAGMGLVQRVILDCSYEKCGARMSIPIKEYATEDRYNSVWEYMEYSSEADIVP